MSLIFTLRALHGCGIDGIRCLLPFTRPFSSWFSSFIVVWSKALRVNDIRPRSSMYISLVPFCLDGTLKMFASFRRDVETFEKRFDEKSKGNGFSFQSKLNMEYFQMY